MDDQKGNKNRLKAIIPFFVKEWSMRLLDGQDMEPDLKSCSCPLLVNTADPLGDQGQCALRKQACHFLGNDSSDTSGVKKKKKNIWASATEPIADWAELDIWGVTMWT